MTVFGYKPHLSIDAESGLPMAYTVTPANTADSEQAIPLLWNVCLSNQIITVWTKAMMSKALSSGQ